MKNYLFLSLSLLVMGGIFQTRSGLPPKGGPSLAAYHEQVQIWEELYVERRGAQPSGHPGTPVRVRRTGMPPGLTGLGGAMSLFVNTDGPPQPGNGTYVSYQVGEGPGTPQSITEDRSLGAAGYYLDENLQPKWVMWRVVDYPAGRASHVLMTLGADGFKIYPDEPSWLDDLPEPVFHVDTTPPVEPPDLDRGESTLTKKAKARRLQSAMWAAENQ